MKPATGPRIATRVKRGMPAAGCLLLAFGLLYGSRPAAEGMRGGLALCAQVVIPSLFPFMVLSGFMATSRISSILARLLSPVTRLLRLPAAAASPLLMGFIGGYPVGARTMASMVREHRLSPRAAGRMLCYSVNAGPPFLLSAVGVGMLGSLPLGGMLLTAQVASSLLIGLVLGLFSSRNDLDAPVSQAYRPYSYCFVQSVNDAASGMLAICAFVVLFSSLQALLVASGAADWLARGLGAVLPGGSPALEKALLFGFLEVTNGCGAAASCGYPGLLAIAFLVSLSGVSVVFQVFSAIHGSGISPRGFLLSRPVHAVLTLGIFWGLLRLFPQALQASVTLVQPLRVTAGSPAGAASLMAMCAVFLLTAGRKGGSRLRRS